jgi:hypothetical protein
LSYAVPNKNLMNEKFNRSRRGRTNTAGTDIPVLFNPHATGFAVKIKISERHVMWNSDSPVLELIDGHSRANGSHALIPIRLFKKGQAMSLLTRLETMLDERRLAAVLKNARKKRC